MRNQAQSPVEATYPPLDVPKPVADGLWIVDSGPHTMLGIELPVRMTVIRLAGGDLVLHSPTRFTEGLKRQLDVLGLIRHLVAPNFAHWIYLRDWQRACPDATTWAAPGLRGRGQVRRSGIRLDRDLDDAAPAEWAGEIALAVVPGGFGVTEIAFFHKPTRTLVLTDLIVNMEPEKIPPLARPAFQLAGIVAPDGRAPLQLRLVILMRRNAAALAVSRMLALHPARVIFAHGLWFDRDGEATARRSLRWLL